MTIRKDIPSSRKIQIMEALGKCLMNKSFADTTIKDIAAEAGVPHGMLHYYFESKQDILMKFLDYNIEKFLSDKVDWFSSEHLDKIPKDKLLREVLSFNLSLVLNNRTYIRIFLEILSIANFDKSVEKKLKDAFKRIEKIETDIIMKSGVSIETASTISRSMISLFAGLSMCSTSLGYKDKQIESILNYLTNHFPELTI